MPIAIMTALQSDIFQNCFFYLLEVPTMAFNSFRDGRQLSQFVSQKIARKKPSRFTPGLPDFS
jgi:hypothetical protein